MPEIVENARGVGVVRRIRREAERRMEKGIWFAGSPLKCDDQSVQRIAELADGFSAGIIGSDGVRFRTSAGRSITLNSVTEAQNIQDAQRLYRAACLQASADLQDSPPRDPESDYHWPDPARFTIG